MQLTPTFRSMSASTSPSLPVSPLTIGASPLHRKAPSASGTFVEIDGEAAYRIENADGLTPFFISVVSDADHWLFASSTGGLSAGRGSPEHPLFPYETVDRIHDAQDKTGSKTILLVETSSAGGDGADAPTWALWEPFSDRYAGLYAIRRSLTKTLQGDRLRYEETNDDLGLTLTVTWSTSERFGFVKQTAVTNGGKAATSIRVLDGVQNLMPYGISREMQETRSVLADAYKKNELVPGTTLGLFMLSAIPVDKAEPSEALKTTTVWSAGIEPDAVLLSTRQLDRFRAGHAVETETAIRAQRGAYFVAATLSLAPGETQDWDTVADIEQDVTDVIALADGLANAARLREAVRSDVAAGTERLRQLVAGGDGEQCTGEPMITARHRMNVLFNLMRGGAFDEGYSISRDDFKAYVTHHNAPVASAHADWFTALPERLTIQALREAAAEGSPQLERLCATYLPLSFSRRHGDPSRPWNHFSIDARHEDGSVVRGYEGNWRDIFQNWEALCRSFPEYLESVITTFVNASTADGYNPYRITAEGIDWEVIEPDDPWSYIGYWGDHQLIYLLRLLDLSRAHHPDALATLLNEQRFSYANVPYRIKPYEALLRDPHDTVLFDAELEREIEQRVEAVGADGKLLWSDGEVHLVTLGEKLLVPLLAKLSNLIPEGGVWMNTQRPEWNDANNALVGYGVSMVTLFALRRYLTALRDLLHTSASSSLNLSVEVAALMDALSDALANAPKGSLSDAERKQVVDALGQAGSAHRETLYTRGLSGQTRTVALDDIQTLLDRAQTVADHTIEVNRREDGLFHAYNLLAASDAAIEIQHLYAMLEGQVAALDAGVLSAEDSLEVLRALRDSDIYRPDEHSYRLYPDRELPSFLEKNNLPEDAIAASPMLQSLIAEGNRQLVVKDVRGGVHFNGIFRNKTDVDHALDSLNRDVSAADRQTVLDAFERVFNHRAYTGRSGTFFGYEGLGSIYWHMVSKLALATQETFWRAVRDGTDARQLDRLADAYYDVRAGLGENKTPEEYGAFPSDAYSHTPGGAKVKQPGMTGQVKEDILCRWGELGLRVEGGQIVFLPLLLRSDEFASEPMTFHFVDVHGHSRTLALTRGMLGFTYCQVPITYRRADELAIQIVDASGAVTTVDGNALSRETSAAIFSRTGSVARIEVDVPPAR